MNRDIQPSSDLSLGNPNPHIKYVDLIKHGYFILDLQAERTQADWLHTDILNPEAMENFTQAWYTNDGENHLQMSESASPPKAQQDIPAPNDPPGLVNTVDPVRAKKFALLSIYPNPFSEVNYLHYGLSERARVNISLFDATGRKIRQLQDQVINKGIYSLKIDGSGLSKGVYFYQIQVDGAAYGAKIMVE